MENQQIETLHKHYEALAKELLALIRTRLLPEGSQELHEARLNLDRWQAKSHILKLVLNLNNENKVLNLKE